MIDVRSAGVLLCQVSADGDTVLIRRRNVYHEIDIAATLTKGQAVIRRVYKAPDCELVRVNTDGGTISPEA